MPTKQCQLNPKGKVNLKIEYSVKGGRELGKGTLKGHQKNKNKALILEGSGIKTQGVNKTKQNFSTPVRN